MDLCLPSDDELLGIIGELRDSSTFHIYMRAMDFVADTQRFFVMDLCERLQVLKGRGMLCVIPNAKEPLNDVWMLTA